MLNSTLRVCVCVYIYIYKFLKLQKSLTENNSLYIYNDWDELFSMRDFCDFIALEKNWKKNKKKNKKKKHSSLIVL